MKIKFDEKNMNVSVLEVGKVYKLQFNDEEGREITMHKALIKSVNKETNEFKYEGLAGKDIQPTSFCDEALSIEMFDKGGNKVLKLK